MKTFKWDEKPNQHSFAYKVTSYPPGIIAYFVKTQRLAMINMLWGNLILDNETLNILQIQKNTCDI